MGSTVVAFQLARIARADQSMLAEASELNFDNTSSSDSRNLFLTYTGIALLHLKHDKVTSENTFNIYSRIISRVIAMRPALVRVPSKNI